MKPRTNEALWSFGEFGNLVTIKDTLCSENKGLSSNITKLPKRPNYQTNQTDHSEADPIKLRAFVKNRIDLYWLQVQRFFRYNRKTYVTYREVSMGNKEQGFTKWHIFTEKEHFKRFVIENVDRFSPPCLHVSQQRYIYVPLLKDLLESSSLLITVEDLKKSHPEAFNGQFYALFTDFVLDLDFNAQKEYDPQRDVRALAILDSELRKHGIELLWKISGNGIHGLLDITELIYEMDLEEYLSFNLKIQSKYRALVEYLEDWLAWKGFPVVFDKQLYRKRGTIRALFSPHPKGLISIYFSFWKPLRLNRERAKRVDPQSHLLPFVSYWGTLDPVSARSFLDLLKIAEFVKSKGDKKVKVRRFIPKGPIQTPPCMKKLIERAKSGEHLPHTARFTLVAYLKKAGWTEEQLIDLFRNDPRFVEKITAYQIKQISEKGYLPHSCERMKELGLCVADCGLKNPLAYLRIQRREGVR